MPWRADVVHCNDWPTALAPAYLHLEPPGRRAASVTAIHNMAHQGVFDAHYLHALGLPDSEKKKIYEGNARRAYPRLGAILDKKK